MGGPNEVPGATGAAYLFTGPIEGTLSTEDAALTLVGDEPDEWTGKSVAGGSDLDGDGWVDLVIGAPASSRGGTGLSGAVYIVSGREFVEVDGCACSGAARGRGGSSELLLLVLASLVGRRRKAILRRASRRLKQD